MYYKFYAAGKSPPNYREQEGHTQVQKHFEDLLTIKILRE